jgi:hypothetical protein
MVKAAASFTGSANFSLRLLDSGLEHFINPEKPGLSCTSHSPNRFLPFSFWLWFDSRKRLKGVRKVLLETVVQV